MQEQIQKIIEKAIEGGWVNVKGATEEQIKVVLEVELKNPYRIVCDPLFWQALGKSCGWDKTKIWLNPYTPKGRYIPSMNVDRWIQEAMNFHEINLTEGFEKAVEYLDDLIK